MSCFFFARGLLNPYLANYPRSTQMDTFSLKNDAMALGCNAHNLLVLTITRCIHSVDSFSLNESCVGCSIVYDL